ncbi:MAG TPA: GNAT family N-acetyltransferase [Pyrinomonadaceae bacterium]|jgi:ribosomal protein S18 acetylase RimI-like enzyme
MSSGLTKLALGGGREIALRPVTAEDYEELVGVYASTRAAELAAVTWWDDAQKMAFCRMQYDAQKKEYDARYPDAQYDVITLGGRTAGRFWVGRGRDEMRLLDIVVLPWAQRQGVGTALVRTLIEEARDSGRRLRHMVFVMNEGARRLYERLGFVVFEEVGGAYLHMEWRPQAGDVDGGRPAADA